MSTQTSAGRAGGSSRPAEHHDWLTEEMNRQHRAGIPNLDNVSDGSVDYDGPRCPDCGTPVPDDGRPLCDSCDELDGEAHPYPCPTCSGNGCRACGDTGERIEWTR